MGSITTATDGADDPSMGGEGELSEDEIFELLSNRRRRFVVHALKRAEEPVDLTDLSVRVTAWEHGVDPEEVQYEDRRNVYTTLRRAHLPKLEEKEVVTVDEDTNHVAATPQLEELDFYVEVLRGREIPWSLYYVGLAGVAASLLVAVALGVPGFAGLDPIDVGAFAATTFGVSSVTHHFVGRRTRLGTGEKPPELRRGK